MSNELARVRAQVEQKVAAWMLEHNLTEPPRVAIGFRCEACDEFCMFEFGEVWPRGECFACGHETPITLENYILVMAAEGGPHVEVWSREEEDGGERNPDQREQ